MLYRLLFAAILLLAIWRPRPLEASRDGLCSPGAFGVDLAGMNLCFYEALDRIPLGIAVTFEFVGPLLVGLFGSRRPLDLVWVALAAAGVLLADGPSGSATRGGHRVRAARGRLLGAPTSCSARGSAGCFRGGRGLALAMGVAAVLMVVPGTRRPAATCRPGGAAAVGAATRVLSSVIPYSLELEALRRIAVGDLRGADEHGAGGRRADRAGRARPGARRLST